MCFEPRECHIQIRLDELVWTNQFSANLVVLGLEFEGLKSDTCNLQATASAGTRVVGCFAACARLCRG